MLNPGLQIEEIRLLHLSRNAPLLLEEADKDPRQGREVPVCFSMFDYFDWLTVQKGQELDHISCLGLNPKKPEGLPLVSSQYLTLVTLKGEPKGDSQKAGWVQGDPFFCDEGMENAFAELPFLSIMLVTILPCPDTEHKIHQAIPYTRQDEVDSFLKGCAGELREVVLKNGSNLCGTNSDVLQAVFQVYHCINSGNFCIAMRCRAPEPAYHIAMSVRAATLNEGARRGFPKLDCNTFSLMGTSYRVMANGKVEVPPPCTQEASRSKTALRLSVTNRVRNLLFQHTGKPLSEELNGLYGRYDVTLQLDSAQFWKLYPWICAHKLGNKFPNEHILHAGEADFDLTDLLKTAMRDHGVQYINTRFLINVDGCSAQDNNGERRSFRQGCVSEENKRIDCEIREMLKLANTLPYCQREFQECMYLLQDLWYSYSSLRYQDDSFINGNMLLAQIGMLLNAIGGYIKSIDPELNEEMFYKTLVNCMRRAINSISHFQKLMLSINQQSIQAPNYEVRMYTDMEKFVVAYTEFSRRFLAEHFPATGAKVGLSEHRQLIFPIITVDMVREAIQAEPLFLLPYHKADGCGLLTSNASQERVLLSIEVPDISAFGHLYATLPLICHELFHNFRVLTRDKRNDALAGFLLRRVAEYIVQRWIDQAHESVVYTAFGDLKNKLLVNTLVEQIETAYRKQCGDAHKTANIGVLISNILLFLSQNVFVLREQSMFRRPLNSPGQIKKNLSQFCDLALNSAETPPSWIEQYRSCYAYLEELERKQSEALKTGESLDADELKDKGVLRTRLRPLVDEVFRDILGECVTQVAEHSLTLSDRVSHLEDQIDRPGYVQQASQITEIGNKIYSSVKQALLERHMPDRIDSCIGDIYNMRHELSELLKEFIETCRTGLTSLTERHFQDLTLAWGAMDYAICNLCRTMKDADYLYLLLCNSYGDEGTLKLYRGVCDHLLKQYHDKIRMQLEQYYGSQSDSIWILHSASQMQELLAPLGCDLEQEKLFIKGLERVLFSCSKKDLEALVNDSTVLYREVFADLGMCVALGLNCFGYLRVLARNDTFCKGCRSVNGAKLGLERTFLVAQILLEQEGKEDDKLKVSYKKFQENCRQYFQLVMEQIEQSMALAAKGLSEWRRVKGQMDHLLMVGKYGIPVQNVPAFPVNIQEFDSWVCNEKKDSVAELYQQVQSLWNLVHLFNYLTNALTAHEEHPLKEHFSSLQTPIAEKWHENEKQHPGSYVLSCVGDAYNDPGLMNIPMRSHEQFKNTLAFVLYYYYHSWNVYEQSFPTQAELQQRLDILMGGASK